MTYHTNPFRLLIKPKETLFKLREAEELRGHWRWTILILLAFCLVYTALGWMGAGTETLNQLKSGYIGSEYEYAKFWFIIGRLFSGLLLGLLVIFVVSLVFYLFYEIPYEKLLIIQLSVSIVFLLEALSWLLLLPAAGLEWDRSPFSFGVLADLFTDRPWVISLFGAVSLFQMFILYFQTRCLLVLFPAKRWHVWAVVGMIYLCYVLLLTLLGGIGNKIVAFIFA
ncbi:hypothetical protein SAMN05421663_101253 [Terribacillus halophilus]|uniref:Yip1 domain-containing protein n=1 Tax=Terribacillus halophilus TaxID=361279 RepID=A0A1G6IE65_9BACI|nr:hypothetical protein [Terribacillus halophilus]SDC04842.1 hypothetical protein SAMN05421663_101253 [Terribacillus halophilus]